jgi:hypothetical protein
MANALIGEAKTTTFNLLLFSELHASYSYQMPRKVTVDGSSKILRTQYSGFLYRGSPRAMGYPGGTLNSWFQIYRGKDYGSGGNNMTVLKVTRNLWEKNQSYAEHLIKIRYTAGNIVSGTAANCFLTDTMVQNHGLSSTLATRPKIAMVVTDQANGEFAIYWKCVTDAVYINITVEHHDEITVWDDVMFVSIGTALPGTEFVAPSYYNAFPAITAAT